MEKVKIYTDGASRGNPGNASIGAVCYDEDEKVLFEISQRVGNDKTNNWAEYEAVYQALVKAKKELGKVSITLHSDSEFLVKQLNEVYKVKNKNIIEQHGKVKAIIEGLDVNFIWIPREENTVADQLANDALDRGSLDSNKTFASFIFFLSFASGIATSLLFF